MGNKAKLRLAPLGIFFGLALPAHAAAEYYVPPGNSAANQYTESLPSAGGEKGGRGKGGAVPAQTLGTRNAHRLESLGPNGKAAAKLAADTSPAPTSATEAPSGPGNGPAAGPETGGGQGSGSQGSPGQPQTQGAGGSGPEGSSGISEVLGQATGSADGGNLGLWLPIIILVTIAGALAYRFAPRNRTTP
jgi:hypothetical protein